MQEGNSSDNEEKFQIRKLQILDKNKGLIELLQQLSICDPISDREFEDRFQEINSCGDKHIVCVIEDKVSGRIVATGTLFIEKKFLRSCGKAAHIEDVVVDSNVHGLHLGKKIVEFLIDCAHSMGCYKVILDCSIENCKFYEKCGFKERGIQMAKYFV